MGMPSFFWWLMNKYPKILSGDLEEKGEHVDGLEFDNFYLDLNEIIHPCLHPDNKLFPPTTFDEILSNMHQRIDRLFNIVRPRKLLFIAIDGVAPRAKMTLIRAGRFQTAMANEIAEEVEEKLRELFEKNGKSLLPKEESQVADPIAITPGTKFMHILSKKLQSYIRRQMSENPAWGNIKVILSDDKVPGEGEHKIMSFIRAQRSSPGYDPNTRHCVHGTDADLIMLALATHEVHFSILREEPIRVVDKRQIVCQFLNVSVLREYLALDLEIPSYDKFEYDPERIIDDFIFICFFAGNDFLPRIPSLQTHEGCIDLLMHIYKKEFQNFGGYLVDMQKVEDKIGGYINFKGVERFILTVGAYEDKILSKRSEMRDRKLRRSIAEYRDKDDEKNHLDDGRASDIPASKAAVADDYEVLRNTVELKRKVKRYIGTKYDLFEDGLGIDKVKFGTCGWRERYYKEKFSAQTPNEIEATRKTVVAKYGEGLCWVLLYYFSEVPSWSWFYPYYYGPLASDLKGLSQIKVEFQKGLPFKPFDQLMGALPPTSAHLLPAAYRGLMIDKNSEIIDFYPTEFETDLDGKRYPWMGIFKLPFIEEARLLMATRKLENELKDHEKIRNSLTLGLLFVRRSSEASQQVVLCCGTRAASMKIEGAIMAESAIEGIKGTLHLMPEDLIEADDDNKGEHSRKDLCMFYEIPQSFRHIPQLLEGVNIPQKTVNKEDIVETILWHEYYGSNRNSNRFQNQRPIKPDQKSEYSSQNTAPAFKPVGELEREEHTSSSLRTNSGTRCHQQPEYAGSSEAGSSRRDNYGGNIERFGKLDMNPRPMSNNRPRPESSSFWPSRSGVTYDANDDWRLNKLSRAAPGDTWQKTQHPNESFSSNTGHGRGREDATKTWKS